MGFFEDLGQLMEKYKFEIHTFNLEENIKIMNQRMHLALTKEDFPPPVILFRTNEGDFVPTEFSVITINNEKHNVTFLNIKDNTIHSIYPIEQKQEVKEQGAKVEKQKEMTQDELTKTTEQLTALAEKLKESGMEWEEMSNKEENNETKVEEKNIKKRSRKSKKQKEELKLEEFPAIVEDFEEIIPKYVYNPDDSFLVVGPLLKKAKSNEGSFLHFLNTHEQKLNKYGSINNMFRMQVTPEIYNNGELKLTTKEGKDVITKLQKCVDDYNVVICLKGWEKATEAKKLVEYAKSKGKIIVEEKDF